jgi:hypothetical protein
MLIRIECPNCDRQVATARLKPPGLVEWTLTRHGTTKVRLEDGGRERRKTPFILAPETAVYSLKDFAGMTIFTHCDRHPASFIVGSDVIRAVKRGSVNKVTIKASPPTGKAVISLKALE